MPSGHRPIQAWCLWDVRREKAFLSISATERIPASQMPSAWESLFELHRRFADGANGDVLY